MKWQPLSPATSVPKTEAELTALRASLVGQSVGGHTVTKEEVDAILAEVQTQEIWKNDLYTVHVRRDPGLVHLSIKRNNREPCHDWRHFQQIKNELVGPENEAVELYPAESRLVDTANQYHLWVFDDPNFRVPVGFPAGLVLDHDGTAHGAKQRPLGEL